MLQVCLYLCFIAIVCIGGYKIKSLSVSGTVMAFFVGCCIAIGFKWQGLVILGLFFTSSSLWSKFKKKQKERLGDILEKGEQRDWVQVFANGSIASVASLLFYFTNDDIWMLAFCVAIAAANSDTWASEIGVLSKGDPIYLLSLQRIEKGTSGAVSPLGLVASVAGATFIAISSVVLFSIPLVSSMILIISFGFLGSIVDTMLGAILQARYTCCACGIVTEKRHHCEARTKLMKGVEWCSNDVVNGFSIFIVTFLVVILT